MLGLVGLRIFEATAADIADLREDHGRLLSLSPTNKYSMRSRRGHQTRRALTAGLRTPRPAGHPGSLRTAAILPWWGSPATRITYLRRPGAYKAQAGRSGRLHQRGSLRGDRSVASGWATNALGS